MSYSTYLSHFFIRHWVKFTLVQPGIPEWILLPVYLLLVALASITLYLPDRGSARAQMARQFRQEAQTADRTNA